MIDTYDNMTMMAVIFLVIAILAGISSLREHDKGQEALKLALHDQRTAENLTAALDQCVQDKAYAAQLDQDLITTRNDRTGNGALKTVTTRRPSP